jgi:nitroreductase
MDFNKVIRKRASIRNYANKKVKYDKVIDAIEAANLAPSPGNIPILNYIIIEDQEKINAMGDCCQQDFIKTAPVVVVICSDPRKVRTMYDKRAEKYIKQHAGAAIENFLLKITEMGLASCWVGAFSETTAKHVLGIPDTLDVEAILPIAYKSKPDKTKQKVKADLGRIVWFEKYRNKYKKQARVTGTH